MVTGIHFLLTYACTYECEHCFVYSSPRSEGTFTLGKLRSVFAEIEKIPTVEWVYFEGGEPFLFYPLMLEGLKMAHDRGISSGVVTNAYWATDIADSEIWLTPLYALGVSDLSVSDDEFHSPGGGETPPQRAMAAARKLGIPVDTIRIQKPVPAPPAAGRGEKGAPVTGGTVMMKGRAVEKLATGLPRRPWEELTECPYEDLANPERVHVDAYGNVHLCQGLSMGNMWETPLSELVRKHDSHTHPVCEPLIRGGPAMLSEEYSTPREDTYIDECHFCFLTRKALLDRFPRFLAPRQVYGLEKEETP